MRRLIAVAMLALILPTANAQTNETNSMRDQINTYKSHVFFEDTVPFTVLVGVAARIKSCGLRPERWLDAILKYYTNEVIYITYNLWPKRNGKSQQIAADEFGAEAKRMVAQAGENAVPLPLQCQRLVTNPPPFAILDASAQKGGWKGD